MNSLKSILAEAKKRDKVIVFPEAGFSDRIIKAAEFLNSKKIAKVVLLGDESALVLRYKNLKGMTIINPRTSDIGDELVKVLYQKRKSKGMTVEEAENLVSDPIVFGALLVETGFADCMVAGAETTSSKVIKTALQIVGVKNKGEIASSFILIQGKNKYMPKGGELLLADVGLNINPTAEEIAIIASQTARSAESLFEIAPKVALLSYSTNGSAGGESAEKMRDAAKILKAENHNFVVDGEMQLDSALIPNVCKLKYPNSNIQGDANVLIFPDLQSGNIAYKAIERFGNLRAVGPIIQGLNKPINDLSRGASVEDIIFTSGLTILMA
ncbi:MAG: phosphate acetyltransferase [Firmicutes bacterium]|nr:phosphate acetyltransferase [Bacillota bacterium]